MRIIIAGTMVFEQSRKRMPVTDYFWDVATVRWPEGEVDVIDELMASAP